MWRGTATVRLARYSMILLAACWALGSFPTPFGGPAAARAFQDPDVAEQPAADAGPAGGGGGFFGKNSDQPAGEGDIQTMQPKSFLGWMVQASGIFGFLLLLLSFIMVALIMMNVLQVRREILMPAEFIESFEQKLDAKDYQGAYDAARGDESFVARVLAAGLAKLSRGYDEAIEGMQEVGEEENMDMEHRLSYLALIGQIAPMIGLMGTVYGMIISFEKIATTPVQPKPADLAQGISMALFTTLEGLTVALPAMIFYSFLKNRVARLMLEAGIQSEGLMARFSNIGKPRAPSGAAPAAAPSVSKT